MKSIRAVVWEILRILQEIAVRHFPVRDAAITVLCWYKAIVRAVARISQQLSMDVEW